MFDDMVGSDGNVGSVTIFQDTVETVVIVLGYGGFVAHVSGYEWR